MSDDLLDERALADAFRSVREANDGTNEAADLTLQRALFRTRARARKQRRARWIVLPVAAALAASTAWAGVTGRLAPALDALLEALHDGRSVPASSAAWATAPAPSATPPEGVRATPPEGVRALTGPLPRSIEPGSTVVGDRAISRAARADTAPSVSATTESSAPLAPSAPDPNAALLAEAHRLHFTERDPARVLVAWDRYLAAAPRGRFVPEARYNRALALVRLGRRAEAEEELSTFAAGAYGAYRRDEAKALLDALAGRAPAR
jgi:hypothetical protein